MTTIVCRKCQKPFDYVQKRGRPPLECFACKGLVAAPILIGKFATSEKHVYSPFDLGVNIKISKDDVEYLKVEPKPLTINVPNIEIEATYKVLVTNMGWAYRGEDEKEARKVYDKNVE